MDAGAPHVARLQEVAESVPPPGPIADHVFLAGTVPFVSRGANTDAGLDAASAAAQRVLSLPRVAPASDYAVALLERDGPGDRERAVALQDAALVLARELGMRPLAERILARREILRA